MLSWHLQHHPLERRSSVLKDKSGLQLPSCRTKQMCCYLFQVHLGSGIWVDEEKWHQLQVTQGDSKYTKNLAVMIWGTDVLKNRSVTGVATKKKKDAIPKPPLSPHKLSIVRGSTPGGSAVLDTLSFTLSDTCRAGFNSVNAY